MIFFWGGQISVPFHEKEKERFDMNITVNGKEYILEYTFEAAECHECIDAAMDIFGGMMTAKIDSKHSEEMQVRDFLMSLSDLPRMAMDMFYAGLLENHGTGPDGDGTITSRADARCLYKQFCKENPEDERATSYYALCTSIAEQMEKDGFFKRTGMEDILENMESLVKSKQKKQPKKPMDHQRKKPTKAQKAAMEARAEGKENDFQS
nr:MAG TPA: tail assembly chaperone protein [Caudoviricetes sp.]